MTSTRSLKKYLEAFNFEKISFVGPFYEKKPLEEPIIFVDRGVNARKTNEGISIGDGDSSKTSKMDILLQPDKDFSDLEYVLKQIPNKYKKMHFYGFLGQRKDHEWANILSVYNMLWDYTSSSIANFDQSIYIIHKTKLNLDYKGSFGLLQLKVNDLEIAGNVKYPFQGLIRSQSSHAISNYSFGALEITSEKTTILFLNEKPAKEI